MYKVSETVGKHVISLYNGQAAGVVENVLFCTNTRKVKMFLIYNYDENLTYLLPVNKIYSIGDSAISIRNTGVLVPEICAVGETADLCNPMNARVFNLKGDSLGKVTEATFSSKYVLENICINNKQELNEKEIASFNCKIMIIYGGEKINIKNFALKTKIITNLTDNRIISIQPAEEEPTQPLGPNRAITNYKFLLNRNVGRNILSFNGELIIKQNTKINSKIIDIARYNGKLKELTMYSS